MVVRHVKMTARKIAFATASVRRNYRKDVTSWRPIDPLPISTSTYISTQAPGAGTPAPKAPQGNRRLETGEAVRQRGGLSFNSWNETGGGRFCLAPAWFSPP